MFLAPSSFLDSTCRFFNKQKFSLASDNPLDCLKFSKILWIQAISESRELLKWTHSHHHSCAKTFSDWDYSSIEDVLHNKLKKRFRKTSEPSGFAYQTDEATRRLNKYEFPMTTNFRAEQEQLLLSFMSLSRSSIKWNGNSLATFFPQRRLSIKPLFTLNIDLKLSRSVPGRNRISCNKLIDRLR